RWREAEMTLVTLFGVLLGASVGSFLNVVWSRVPRGQSITHPRSRCGSCRRTLVWWENVPVLAWVALGGRCRTCRAPIGVRTLLVELAGAVTGGVVARASLEAARG